MVEIVPVSGEDPEDAALFAAWNDVFTAVDRERFGPQERGWTLDELRGRAASPYSQTLWLAALDADGAVLGGIGAELPTSDNSHLAHGRVAVRPGEDVEAVADPLLRDLERRLREAGREALLLETEWAAGRTDSLGEDYLAARGFAPAQTVLRSEMALPADADRLAALADGEPAYVLETSVDGMPDGWLADRARLQARMSTDTPLGEVPLEPEEWSEQRMRDWVEATLASRRRWVETVARHVDSGRLVGFTTLTVSEGDLGLAYQWDTLVLREHRGHRLGLRLKAANVLALQRAVPTATRVRTWNADDNAHMLAVNTVLGYRIAGYQREWRGSVTATGPSER